MKKVLQITILLSWICMRSMAQTAISNGSFENWSNVGATNAVPQYWNSNMNGSTIATYGGQTCWEYSTAHSGNHSAQIISGSYFGQVINGALTTGYVNAPNFTKADGFIESDYNTGTAMQFVGRPDSLVFWYQYTPSGTDNASVQARLHVGHCYAPEAPSNGNHPDSVVNIIARALWTSGTGQVSSWTRVSIPFIYVDGRIPQYIFITSTSSASNTGGSSGSTLLLDDFLAYYIPVLTTSTVSTGPYYVTATNSTSISVPFTLTGTVDSTNVVTAQLSNASGSFASPVNIGTLTTMSSGTISATIPAGTVSSAGYRVRVVSSHPVLTAADNGSNITINLVSTSVAPSAAQNIAANTNGNLLTVTETVAATSRQWQYSTISGGPYQAFGSPQTGTTYTPDFSTAGTYYVVCVSAYPGSLNATSNQVQVNVVSNSIAPTSSQSILVGVPGTTLTVTETPGATSRQWKYSTTSGSGYVAFGVPQTGTTYIPNFASAGSYYVVCESVINGVTAISNEVLVTVGSATITTQAVTGSPFLFSHSAPAAGVSVGYVTSGTFNGGNVFTAQLSDASGSFSAHTNIGQLTATGSGSVSANIPSNTPAGTAYRIRVVSSNPNIIGSDNGSDLVIDQFHSSVSPGATQTIPYNTNGQTLTVSASQTSTYVWKYSTVSGSGYVDFSVAQTGSTYTPNFAVPGTYYVVCISTNQYSDADTSNEAEIIVLNGTTLTTLAISGSPFLVSDSAHVQINVNFASDAQFNAGNTFVAQLSDNTGNFANPDSIGSITATTSTGTIPAVIPNSSVAGSHYRIRVVSTNPAITGTPDSTDLMVIPFAISLSPLDTQTIVRNQYGHLLTAASTQPATYNWQYSEVSGNSYISFSPGQTGDTLLPKFININTYYVVCNITNAVHASLLTPEVVVIVTATNAITETPESVIKAYWDHNDFVVDLTDAKLKTPVLELVNVTGQVVLKTGMTSMNVNRFMTRLPQGVYIFKIVDGEQSFTGKTAKK